MKYSEAFEEFVADSMEKMLTDKNAVEKLAMLRTKDKTVFDKLREGIQKLVDRIKQEYAKLTPDSAEGRTVATMTDVFRDIQDLFLEALDDASTNFQKAEKNTITNDGVKMQTRSVNGKEIVWIEENILKKNTGTPIHQFIADYIANHIGEYYKIIESGQRVYIGEDLPNEYTQSKYTQAILRNNPNILKTKNKAVKNLGEMIEIATNRRWEKVQHAHNKDAKYGIYRYDTRFGFAVQNSKKDIVGANVYTAELIICNASDGKKYLYDIVNIKRDKTSSDWLTQRTTSAAKHIAGQKSNVSDNSVPQENTTVNNNYMQETRKNSLRDSTGRELPPEVAEYFKDSKARDRDGNLLVLYHQTDGYFTVFDTHRQGAGSADNETPYGVFLKSNSKDIGLKGKNQIPLYANITNPLVAENRQELVYKISQLSVEYLKLHNRRQEIDTEYSAKNEKARNKLRDFITKWREQNKDADSRILYDKLIRGRFSD